MDWKMEIAMYLCFFLTTGEGQPDPNGPAHVAYAIPMPPQELRTGQIPNPFINLPPGPISHARPCRRRNFPDTGWVPITLPYDLPQNFNRDDQVASQPAVSELKPRSLTENNYPSIDDNQETDKTGQIPDDSVKTGLLEENFIPNQPSESRRSNGNENQIPGRVDTAFNDYSETSRTGQNSIPEMVFEDTSKDRMDRMASPDESAECEDKIENSEQDLTRNDNRRKNTDKIQESLMQLITDCVQNRNDEKKDLPSNTRRSFGEPDTSLVQDRNDEEDDLPGDTRRSFGRTDASPNPKSNDDKSDSRQESREAPYLQNPAKNADKWTADSRISLLHNGRVCYACSTYFDQSCRRPNATTTIKYCNKFNNACVNKSFRVDGKKIMIRDCGHTCKERDSFGVHPKSDSCTICYSDMCNSAYAFNVNALIIMFIIAAVKCTY